MRSTSPEAYVVSANPLTRELLGEILRVRFGLRVTTSAMSRTDAPAAIATPLLVWDTVGGFASVPPGLAAARVVRIDASTRLEDVLTAVRKQLGHAATSGEQLTPHEVEVLLGVASGQRNAEIARRQRRSVKTVEKHRANLQRKLGMRTVAQLTAYAVRNGLLDLDAILARRSAQ